MTSTDVRRLQEAELTIAEQAATIRRLEEENFYLRSQVEQRKGNA